MDGPVPHHALLAHLFAARLELGLNQADGLAAGGQQLPDGGQNQGQGDKGDVHREELQLLGDLLPGEIPGVGALQVDHPGVVAQVPGQLAVAHVHGVDFPRALLEHAVGKTAG